MPARWRHAAPIRPAFWNCFYGEADSINQPVCDLAIAVDATISKERPIAANVFHDSQIDGADQDFFFVMRGFRDDTAEGVAQKRPSPKFQSVSRGRGAADVAVFMSDAVYHRYVDSIGDGVSALNGAPGVVVGLTKLGFLRGM